ncbi:glycosyltransferase [Rhizobium sp. PL01]|uniref:glycosyltransferase n=1 Tax=Rhizobium sp. PL01 TaxID=3085631 RepID=UPI0029824D7F|nr:glycosyltransferase [Rhizobium sp. PL01]MDW5315314.1 glycosyltransferase [Rhizobium sp. PL01]
MFAQPKLTICVPSRNRQRYFQETITSLVMNLRTDIEFVFADNSDDASIMSDFIADVVADPRVKFIPPAGRVLSMVDNWERCLEVATGEFVCVIGDDDYVDPDVVDLIKKIQGDLPKVEAIAWSRLTYNWPDFRPRKCVVSVPMGSYYVSIPRDVIYRDFFHWSHEGSQPNCLFSVYHGAVSLATMKRIRAKFNGRFFEHPVVDFENTCKVLVTAQNFVHVERPFSIMGSCAESNSGRIHTAAQIREVHAQFMSETGRNIDGDAYMKNFPFPLFLGNTAAIGMCQQWFKFTYGYKAPAGWQKNFARACALSCGGDKENFDYFAAGYQAAFEAWEGGAHLDAFKPEFKAEGKAIMFFGLIDKNLYIDEDIAGVTTPGELFQIVKHMIAPLAQMEHLTQQAVIAKSA